MSLLASGIELQTLQHQSKIKHPHKRWQGFRRHHRIHFILCSKAKIILLVQPQSLKKKNIINNRTIFLEAVRLNRTWLPFSSSALEAPLGMQKNRSSACCVHWANREEKERIDRDRRRERVNQRERERAKQMGRKKNEGTRHGEGIKERASERVRVRECVCDDNIKCVSE